MDLDAEQWSLIGGLAPESSTGSVRHPGQGPCPCAARPVRRGPAAGRTKNRPKEDRRSGFGWGVEGDTKPLNPAREDRRTGFGWGMGGTNKPPSHAREAPRVDPRPPLGLFRRDFDEERWARQPRDSVRYWCATGLGYRPDPPADPIERVVYNVEIAKHDQGVWRCGHSEPVFNRTHHTACPKCWAQQDAPTTEESEEANTAGIARAYDSPQSSASHEAPSSERFAADQEAERSGEQGIRGSHTISTRRYSTPDAKQKAEVQALGEAGASLGCGVAEQIRRLYEQERSQAMTSQPGRESTTSKAKGEPPPIAKSSNSNTSRGKAVEEVHPGV